MAQLDDINESANPPHTTKLFMSKLLAARTIAIAVPRPRSRQTENNSG
jgi:hypothetical protein